MALSALAVENKKLNHKRPELQLLPVGLGEGRVAPHRGGPSGGRGYWFQKSSPQFLTQGYPHRGRWMGNTEEGQVLMPGGSTGV